MTKLVSYFFQSIFIYLFFLIIKVIGLRLSRNLFSLLFVIIGPIFKSKKIIEKNLNIYSNNISNFKKSEIIKSMWKNYGMTFVEYIYLKKFRNNKDHIKIEGEENLKNLLENNTSAIFISGHFANFELMSMEITKKNIPLASIYRPLNNYFLNPFMEYLRKTYICKNQIKKGINGVRESIEFIKKNYCVALMIDQRVSEGEKVELFKKPALTTTLPAQLAIKFNLPIIPVFLERRHDNNFYLKFYNKINHKDFKNKNELSKKLNETLEEMIEKNPYQWIWTHDRWK